MAQERIRSNLLIKGARLQITDLPNYGSRFCDNCYNVLLKVKTERLT